MNKILIIVFVTLLSGLDLFGQTITGNITEKSSGEPLIGVTVRLEGTTIGTTTDFDGNFVIKDIPVGTYPLLISYVSFCSITSDPVTVDHSGSKTINFEMEEDNLQLEEVVVTARRNMESENVLIIERKNSSIAIENLGAKEMSIKGISNVADGVKKITGIALADAGQIYVRGLGDRYNSTSLNGLSIASPNPDNKLIPLDLFPSSTVKNITVGKVYQVGHFADYSGAHIDISTKDNFDEDYFSISIGTGGVVNTVGETFYSSESKGGILGSGNLSQTVKNMNSREFSEYIKSNDVFETSFSPSGSNALPDLSGTIGLGKNWEIGSNRLSLLTSLGVSNDKSTKSQGYVSSLNTQGDILNEFKYDSYSNRFKITGLTSLNYTYGDENKITYVLFYARNLTNDFRIREGFDSEGISLTGTNSVSHIYSLLNNQLSGQHSLNENLTLNWSSSFGITGSDEPDRRQVMYRNEEEVFTLFKLNRQETMRYFGELNENEIVGETKLTYQINENNQLRFGGAYKNKHRDFSSTRFYYNVNNIDQTINDILDTESFLNQDAITNETITLTKDFQPRSQYFAGSNILAFYSELDYYPLPNLLLNFGLRFESSGQWVRYWNDASIEKLSELDNNDLFPAINMKYDFSTSNIRLSASKTVTRPLFIEIAPFLYKESYGSDEIRGNEDLQNGYNYNIDLKYELYANGSRDIYTVALYYKYLQDPIERVQESSGGSAVHSFRNAQDGLAIGTEIEIKKNLMDNLRIGFNVALMYTNIILPEGTGIYTDSNRALQGASPYLVNADITYAPKLGLKNNATFSLLYNLQGPRIHAVGIFGMNNVIQQPVNTLNLISEYSLGGNKSIKLKVSNILNNDIKYTQKITETGEDAIVQSYKDGLSIDLGFSYKF